MLGSRSLYQHSEDTSWLWFFLYLLYRGTGPISTKLDTEPWSWVKETQVCQIKGLILFQQELIWIWEIHRSLSKICTRSELWVNISFKLGSDHPWNKDFYKYWTIVFKSMIFYFFIKKYKYFLFKTRLVRHDIVNSYVTGVGVSHHALYHNLQKTKGI